LERLRQRDEDARRALKTLEEVINEPYSLVVRDATIQRFEYTFEAVWKFLREYLKNKEGIVCNSPKSCFRETFGLGFLKEEEAVEFLEMTDRRNETSHTYKEEVAQLIYSKTKGYFFLMQNLVNKLADKM
jgi:nucleotidyltransferase substrate binding protein (TIGR01987 family)